MGTDNQNLPNPILQQPKKWYQHKGLLAVIILVVVTAIVVYAYLVKKNLDLYNATGQTQFEDYTKSYIPETVSKNADIYIISNVGQNFFNKYISRKSGKYYKGIDCINCSNYLHEPHYLMIYSLKLSNDSKTQGLIEFAVDTDGNIIKERESFGIPSCIQEPAKCIFISKDEAIKIAENANFKKGIEQWKIDFTWGSKEKTYLWGIQNTLYNDRSQGTEGGEVMGIDANSGKIIYTNSWSAIP